MYGPCQYTIYMYISYTFPLFMFYTDLNLSHVNQTNADRHVLLPSVKGNALYSVDLLM